MHTYGVYPRFKVALAFRVPHHLKKVLKGILLLVKDTFSWFYSFRRVIALEIRAQSHAAEITYTSGNDDGDLSVFR